MRFVDVDLAFFEEIRWSMETQSLTEDTVVRLGLRVKANPHIGRAAPEYGPNVFDFYWREPAWKEDYRVLYRRIDTIERTEVALIAVKRVAAVPKTAARIEAAAKSVAGKVSDAALDMAVSALRKALSGGAG